MVELFLRGGAFMWPILAVFIIGLLFVIERMISLSLSTVNTKKFVVKVNQALQEGGPARAKEVCEKTRGPIASVFHAGLQRLGYGVDQVEKNIMNAGQIEMSFLEKNLVWLSTVIAIAPMLGFTGTVAGMVGAFDAIAAANDISPAIVADGISQALLTTLFGLIVAMIIQFFNNFFVSRIDKIVADMQEASVEFVDTLMDYQAKHGGVVVSGAGVQPPGTAGSTGKTVPPAGSKTAGTPSTGTNLPPHDKSSGSQTKTP